MIGLPARPGPARPGPARSVRPAKDGDRTLAAGRTGRAEWIGRAICPRSTWPGPARPSPARPGQVTGCRLDCLDARGEGGGGGVKGLHLKVCTGEARGAGLLVLSPALPGLSESRGSASRFAIRSKLAPRRFGDSATRLF